MFVHIHFISKLFLQRASLLCLEGQDTLFVLSLDNDAYVANPQKVEPSVDKALDYAYFFCSRNSRKHHTNASGVVGKMKLSSSLTLNSNRSKFMETEFVLFGRREDFQGNGRIIIYYNQE